MDPDWAALSRELLNLVVERLETPKEFSLVCKSWRSAAKDIQTHFAVTTTPMILISSHTDKDKWHLYNPLNDKVLKTDINLGRHERICGSSKGWLIAVNGHRTVSLINPFLTTEKSIVRLPPLNPPKLGQFEHEIYYVYQATISADPISDADNCIIMVRCDMYSAFLRLNKDSKWSYAHETVDIKWWWFLQDVVQFEDRFYAVDVYGKPYSFDAITTDQSISDMKVVVRECGRQQDGHHVKIYLVVCNEKTILMVQMCRDGFDGRRKPKFRVFELDISKGEWTEKNTLGDVALFVCYNSSISVCASKSGYRANCIYFFNYDVRDERGLKLPGAYDCGVYNVEERRVLENPFHGDPATLMRETAAPPIWIVPTYNL